MGSDRRRRHRRGQPNQPACDFGPSHRLSSFLLPWDDDDRNGRWHRGFRLYLLGDVGSPDGGWRWQPGKPALKKRNAVRVRRVVAQCFFITRLHLQCFGAAAKYSDNGLGTMVRSTRQRISDPQESLALGSAPHPGAVRRRVAPSDAPPLYCFGDIRDRRERPVKKPAGKIARGQQIRFSYIIYLI